jgi:phosphoribosylaminoimidazolecarboxamide formyltransferase/IMP cyclohydrolase
VPIRRALISVSNKTGLVEFAKFLVSKRVEILSTGGTAKALRDNGIVVRDVAEYTESPEIMDGRVKTLHPRVHGGLLMRDNGADEAQLLGVGGAPIDLVVVNLYPFEQTVARQAPHDEIIENIDIGGPSMIRSAAKNHERVTVVVDPSDYALLQEHMEPMAEGVLELPSSMRATLAQKAFEATARYDAAIASYLASKLELAGDRFAPEVTVRLQKVYGLRYGENPHQQGAFYREVGAVQGTLAQAESLGTGAKELSYNNLVDCDAALEAVREFDEPAAVVVKHTNPCGVAQASSLREAYFAAREADALSAFGGIVALNRVVDEPTARLLVETFLECVIAPAYDPAALEVLRGKKNLRVLATGAWLAADHPSRVYKQVSGGFVVQDRDATARGEVRGGKVVTKRLPTEQELDSMEFAWKVCKHVKSNAIVLAQGMRTVGVGAGQMSRVVSVEIALQKAQDLSVGAALASDAFFPFADGLQAAARRGVSAVAQPGGSVRDEEVIAAADEAGIAMVFTAVRHFRHG